MKRHWLLLAVFIAGCILLSQVGCQKQRGQPPQPGPEVTKEKPPVGPVDIKPAEDKKKGPRITFEKVVHDFGEVRITFEKVVHDFGEVAPGTKHRYEFKFTNTGDEMLRVKRPTSSCACTVGQLSKPEYAPGESGLVKVTKFLVPKHQGIARQQLVVSSNDKAKPKVKLTVKAKVVPKVAHEPKSLKLLLNDENAGCPEIKLTSLDGQPFAIKSFKATTGAITADYDSSVKATSHVIQPKVNTKMLQKHSKGLITIELTHPGCNVVSIPFDVLSRFQITPPSIILYKAEPGKSIKKTVWLRNNYGEDFEVESVSSEKGIIKVLSQERVDNRYKFELEITPPTDTGKERFTDVLHINIKGGEKLTVDCNGFYSKE
jgi:hypothetical protein